MTLSWLQLLAIIWTFQIIANDEPELMPEDMQTKIQHIYTQGDLYIKHNLKADRLQLMGKNSMLTCVSVTSQTLNSENVMAHEIDADHVSVENVYPKTQDYIKIFGHMTINGAININNRHKNTSQTTSFIQINQQLVLNEVHQWIIVDTNHFFNQKSILDWKVTTIKNSFFQIQRDIQNRNLQNQVVSVSPDQVIWKDLNLGLKHEYLKLEGNFYYLSGIWEGQVAYIKVDSQIVWMDSHDWTDYQLEQQSIGCDGLLDKINQFQHRVNINFVVRNSSPRVKVEIGTEILQKHVQQNQYYQCFKAKKDIQVFGFDELNLYIK